LNGETSYFFYDRCSVKFMTILIVQKLTTHSVFTTIAYSVVRLPFVRLPFIRQTHYRHI